MRKQKEAEKDIAVAEATERMKTELTFDFSFG